MGGLTVQPWAREAWDLARRQHWVVTSAQLAALGMKPRAIEHRLASGRLHRLMRGVYAVGRPHVSQHGWWMAAVLVCGPRALLNHRSAAALWGIRPARRGDTHVVVPPACRRRRPGIRSHRRRDHDGPGRREVDGIPVTHPVATLVDLAAEVPDGQLEAAINEADHLELVDPERLRDEIDELPRWPGRGRLRELLDGPTITLTSTQLERRFLPLARRAGLPAPTTQAWLDGYRVDFFWPNLGLVVEADSLRYHRTPFKQARDKRRDNAHAGSGLATLRFTHGQIRDEPGYVCGTLARTARLRASLGA
ncbi:MAG TPA: type IV toxin-antitoxin system AbiEi family antitoxin domain-containing protein [Solirubrobacterales bacterium]|nr:type IV toxin-antitoxin system AbiEi family antitoxin domain-containing protein [Solirubrobacterales bacterium]